MGADPGDCARDNDGGQVGWSADLLTKVAEGVVRDLSGTLQNYKFRAVASPLRIEIQLIGEACSRMKLSLILLRYHA